MLGNIPARVVIARAEQERAHIVLAPRARRSGPALYSSRSEREFCERLRHVLLFKFFLDLNVAAEGFGHRHLQQEPGAVAEAGIADIFSAAVVKQALTGPRSLVHPL
jgi:hypothetical protein